MRKTLNVRRMSARSQIDHVVGWLFDPETITNGEFVEYPEGVRRPRTRGECEHAERPCPFVSCSMHLYLDVNPQTGAIKHNFPHLEVWDMKQTCALDVGDTVSRGKKLPLATLAECMGLSYDRAFQCCSEALVEAKRVAGEEPEWPSGDGHV